MRLTPKVGCPLLRLLIVVFVLSGVLFVGAVEGRGQAVTSSRLTGNVLDTSGAVVPGATIMLINRATGVTRTFTSDENGYFSFLELQAGTYNLQAEMVGFKGVELNDIRLSIGETLRIKVQLEVGRVAETVTVNAEAMVIESTRAEIGTVVEQAQLANLPLNQRSFTALVTQQPNLVTMTNLSPPTVIGAATNQGSYISANGQMSLGMSYLMDGVTLGRGTLTAPGTVSGGDMPGVEAIEEFSVLTNLYSSAYGGASSAVVSFSTKSGGNQYHGSAYEYIRNDALDARNFFDREKPPFRRNQFGVAVSGPIKSNKTFFFGNYEGLRQRLTTTQIAFVPTTCARNGGLGGACDFPVFGPGNVPVAIPREIKSILELYPEPNGPGVGQGIAQLVYRNRQPKQQDFGLFNVTHSLGQNDQLGVRYSITNGDAETNFNSPVWKFFQHDRNQNFLLKWTHTFSPRFLGTFGVAVLRNFIRASTGPANPLRPDQFWGNRTHNLIGSFGASGLTGIGNDSNNPLRLGKNIFPFSADFVRSQSRHTFKLGGLVERYHWNYGTGYFRSGSWSFNSLNDLLANNPGQLTIYREGQYPEFGTRSTLFGWYVEDAWQVRPRLTITAGLRHEFQVPLFKDVHNRLANFRYPNDLQTTIGNPVNNYTLTQFQPRLGIAWDISGNGKTVLRTGYGLFNAFLDFAGLAQGNWSINAPLPGLVVTRGQPFGGARIPFPTCGLDCTVPVRAGRHNAVLWPVNSPTSSQWSLEVQRRLSADMAVNATYNGSQSYHIQRNFEGNYKLPCRYEDGKPVWDGNCPSFLSPQVLLDADDMYAERFDTTARYHSLTFGARRRLTANMPSFQVNYTFAKGVSASDSYQSGIILQGFAQYSQWGGDWRLDLAESSMSIRHRIVANSVYELPFGRDKRFLSGAHGLAEALLGGWKLSGTGTFQSGYPLTVDIGVPQTNSATPTKAFYVSLPDIVPGANQVSGIPTGYLNLKAYKLPRFGYLGNAPRTSLRGPRLDDVDIGLEKSFSISETKAFRFRGELFNVLNHPNFGIPSLNLYVNSPQFRTTPTQAQLDALPCTLSAADSQKYSCNPTAGRITKTVLTPRQVQFSLRFMF